MLFLMDGEKRWEVKLLDEGTLDTVVRIQQDWLGCPDNSVIPEHTCRFSPDAVTRDANGYMTDWELIRLAVETLDDFYDRVNED